MHSFASALIAAALATLSSAAPVGLPAASLAASVSVPLSTNLPLPTGTIPLGEVKPVTDPEVPGVHARAAALSVAAIFTDIQTKIQPYTEQLSTLEQYPHDPSLTCFDRLHCSLQHHDRRDHQPCFFNQGPHYCSRS